MAARSKRKTARKTRAKARSKAIAAATGPVTLDEAKALALAKHPKLAARAMRKSAAPPASPASVGAERKKLNRERREEFANRIREYKATMAIMKRRGARRPRSKSAANSRLCGICDVYGTVAAMAEPRALPALPPPGVAGRPHRRRERAHVRGRTARAGDPPPPAARGRPTKPGAGGEGPRVRRALGELAAGHVAARPRR